MIKRNVGTALLLILLAADRSAQTTIAASITNLNKDTKPPVITVVASPSFLWPPNGSLIQVTVRGRIKDPSGIDPGSPVFSVRDEYRSVEPRGPITIGPGGAYSFTILLQALRDDQDLDGRWYWITITARDNDGNAGRAVTAVVVPHDQRN